MGKAVLGVLELAATVKGATVQLLVLEEMEVRQCYNHPAVTLPSSCCIHAHGRSAMCMHQR